LETDRPVYLALFDEDLYIRDPRDMIHEQLADERVRLGLTFALLKILWDDLTFASRKKLEALFPGIQPGPNSGPGALKRNLPDDGGSAVSVKRSAVRGRRKAGS